MIQIDVPSTPLCTTSLIVNFVYCKQKHLSHAKNILCCHDNANSDIVNLSYSKQILVHQSVPPPLGQISRLDVIQAN